MSQNVIELDYRVDIVGIVEDRCSLLSAVVARKGRKGSVVYWRQSGHEAANGNEYTPK